MTFMPRSKCADGKVLKARVCADSAALSDDGVNNNGSAAGSGGAGGLGGGGVLQFDWQYQSCLCHQFNGNYYLMYIT